MEGEFGMDGRPRTDGVYRRTWNREHTHWLGFAEDGTCSSGQLAAVDFTCRWFHQLSMPGDTWKLVDGVCEMITLPRHPKFPGTNRSTVLPGCHGAIEGLWLIPVQTVTGVIPPPAFFRFEPLTPAERMGSVAPLVARVRDLVDSGRVTVSALQLAEELGEGIASKVLGHKKPRTRAPTQRTLTGIAQQMLALGPETVLRAAWCVVDRGDEAWRHDAAALLSIDRTSRVHIDAFLCGLTSEQPVPWRSEWNPDALATYLRAALLVAGATIPDPFTILRGGLSSWLLGVDDPLVDAALPAGLESPMELFLSESRSG